MKIKEIRTRAVHWRGKTVPLPPHFCTNPMDLAPRFPKPPWAPSPSTAGSSSKFSPTTASSASATPPSRRPITKQVIDLYLKPLLHRRRSLGHRISLAAHVSQDHGLRPQRHRHGRHQRRGHRPLGSPRQIRQATGLPPARRPHQAAIPVYASRLYSTPLERTRRRSQAATKTKATRP